MAAPLNNDDLTRVAAYLAAEERKKRGAPVPQQVLDRVYTNRHDGIDASTFSGTGFSKAKYEDGARSSLEDQGYRYLPQSDFDAMRSGWNPVAPPAGKLPFISGTPTHAAPKTYSTEPPSERRWSPEMAGVVDQMNDMETSTQRTPRPSPLSVMPPSAPAAKGSGAAKRSREVSVSTTSMGAQPQARDFQPLAQLAPEQAEQRLAGLPEGVATLMRKRMGLEDAQADANRRALAVEIASAGNQIGSGLAGGRYDDSVWAHQRQAASQPLEDYQARSAEEHQQAEDQRRHDADERAIREAERAARMEEAKFQYGKEHDKAQDTLKQKGLDQDMEIAKMRASDAQKDRWLRHQEILARAKESQEAKKTAADQKRQDMLQRQDEKDLQALGQATSKAPFGEMQQALEEIDRLAPGMAYGQVPDESPIGLGDRVAQTILPRGAADWVMSEKGKRYSTATANLRDLVSRARSGAVLNANEERQYLNLLSDDKLSDPRTGAYGMNEVRKGLAQKLRNAQGAYANAEPGAQSTLDKYEASGATTYRAPIFGAAPPRQTGRTITRADGSVWAELDNGEAEQISPPRR